MQLTPINTEDRELMALPSIASQMPVTFTSGACWTEIQGACKVCGAEIEPANFTGRVSKLVETVATVHAVGVCTHCKVLSRFHYRLHSDMRLTGLTQQGWATWRFQPSFLDRLMSRLSGVFR